MVTAGNPFFLGDNKCAAFRTKSEGFKPHVGTGLPGKVWETKTLIWKDDVQTNTLEQVFGENILVQHAWIILEHVILIITRFLFVYSY